MPVHVSIHDVSPAHEPQVDLALEYCAAVGSKPALLVVPNFHGQWPLREHPAFCERLRRLRDQGHEIYLHGFFHRAGLGPARGDATRDDDGKPRGASKWFAQKIVSAGEAEFSDVSKREAEARLDEGARVLEEIGLAIDGFVAPAWSMPRWVLPMLGARGYRFTEDHTTIYDPRTQRSRASVVLNYASRTPSRLVSSVAYCRLARPARLFVPARVAIHPADMRYTLLRHEVQSLLAWAKDDLVARGDDLLS